MTYRRVLQDIVSVEELERLMGSYHQQQLKMEQEVIFSMDGKTVRGTIPAGEYRGTHLLAIYVPEQGLVLAEAEVDRKENEIVVAPHLLNQVTLQVYICLMALAIWPVLGDCLMPIRKGLWIGLLPLTFQVCESRVNIPKLVDINKTTCNNIQ